MTHSAEDTGGGGMKGGHGGRGEEMEMEKKEKVGMEEGRQTVRDFELP